MSAALDVGAHRIRSLRRDGDRLLGRGCRSLYAVLPDSATQRAVLDRTGIPYAVCEDVLALMGDGAAVFSRTFQAPTVPLFPSGSVPTDDPPARQIIAALIDSLLPPPAVPGEPCCLTVPGVGRTDESPGTGESTLRDREWQFLSRVVRLRGYRPVPISPGLAVVLAELVDCAFTGIGLDFGASRTDVVLAHRGQELARCTVPRGGQWIDEQIALLCDCVSWDASGQQFLDAESAREWKENAALLGGGGLRRTPPSPQLASRAPAAGTVPVPDRLLADLYGELVEVALKTAARTFAEALRRRQVPGPLSVACGGGTARIPGFAGLLERTWQRTPFPVEIDGIRIVADDEYGIARGCLVRAEIESQPQPAVADVA